jgi:hypothetical protein
MHINLHMGRTICEYRLAHEATKMHINLHMGRTINAYKLAHGKNKKFLQSLGLNNSMEDALSCLIIVVSFLNSCRQMME